VRVAGAIVSAGKDELGDCFYVESENRTCGIKVTGRSAGLGERLIIGGVLATHDGEREIAALSVDPDGTGSSLKPIGMPLKSIGGGDFFRVEGTTSGQIGIEGMSGLNNIGLLVKCWGKAGSIDQTSKTFTLEDGSGRFVKCVAPNDPTFSLPSDGAFMTITGISSMQGEPPVSIIRIRSQNDVN
jgi:hypothetical protein